MRYVIDTLIQRPRVSWTDWIEAVQAGARFEYSLSLSLYLPPPLFTLSPLSLVLDFGLAIRKRELVPRRPKAPVALALDSIIFGWCLVGSLRVLFFDFFKKTLYRASSAH